jgi:hypothetical protein
MDWEVEDRIFVRSVQTEVLSDGDLPLSAFVTSITQTVGTYIVEPSCRIDIPRRSLPNETIRPHPIDMLHRTPILLSHNLTQTPIRRCAIGDGEVPSRDITREKDRDVVDGGDRVRGIWR